MNKQPKSPEEMEFYPLKRAGLYPGIISSLGIFVLYLYTICPTVPPGDSGELITSAYCLGVAHSPGYPLYMITGKLFSLIPAGNIAWRLNLMSAFFNSMTVFLIYIFVLKITGKMMPALFASFSLGFSYIFWLYSIYAEVFALNSFLIMLLIILIFQWREESLKKEQIITPVFIAFLAGLSLTNQQTAVLFFPSLLYVIVATRPDIIKKPRILSAVCCFFVLGLLVYLYLPIASRFDPYIDWGNPETLENFLRTLTRKDYGTLSLSKNFETVKPSFNSIIVQLRMFLSMSAEYMSLPGIFFAFIGIVWLLRNRIVLAITMFTGLFFTGPFFFFLSRMDDTYSGRTMLSKFMCTPSIFWAILSGFGFFFIISLIEKKGQDIKPLSKLRSAISFVILIMFSSYIMFSSMPQIKINSSRIAEEFGLNLFDTLEKNAILFVSGDTPSFIAWYFQYAEKKRPDIKIISIAQPPWRAIETYIRYPELFGEKKEGDKRIMVDKALKEMKKFSNSDEYVKSIIENNKNRNQVYFDSFPGKGFENYSAFIAPEGVAVKLLKNNTPKDMLNSAEQSIRLLNSYRMKEINKAKLSKEFMIKEFLFAYSGAYNYAGYIYQHNNRFDEAEKAYLKSVEICPDSPLPSQNIMNIRNLKSQNK